MHGRECEERKRRRHMSPVPTPGTAPPPPPQLPAATSASPVTLTLPSTTSGSPPESDSPLSSCDFFLKDGRKIEVGSCALFQSGNAPPFIGLIRCIGSNKEENLKLCINWLYRPADIKLAKGIPIEAAPNEVFYSFHKDDIPAASLLHPCKVAFLRKGIELPLGISSFVCRRVYVIANKCLWWLTDKDNINERQEEVDQLLDRTRQEMHAAVQSGGRSPKPSNGSAHTQQSKSGSESAQNTVNSFPSQSKKKRDRVDQGIDPIKWEHSVKPDDSDSVNVKLEIIIKEIAKITEKGGLVSTEGVEKLVNLMLLDRSERKIDITGRILVSEVIAATDRYDCLGRFVQLKGVAIFDDWLQEAHKGKSGDGSPKECDKVVEDLLLSLLRALDKLPVNLNALQACNIGKSVNHLRSHKNTEIQKKARTLVDTWKKRVDAEMTKINDAKCTGSNQPVAWPANSGFSDVSHGGNKRHGSSEFSAKSSVHQPVACKSLPGKTGHSDAIAKSVPVPPGPVNAALNLPPSVSVSSNTKLVADSGGPEVPPTLVKEEKSSSSSQSQNNSQSWSGDHMKAIGSSCKEDARSSTSGSVTKAASGSSRHRRSSKGSLAMVVSGTHKDNNLVKSVSPSKLTPLDKTSQSGLTCEKPVDMSTSYYRSSHKLIVRLTNIGRSPARNASGGSFEDPSAVGSRASSSPGVPDKHEHGDRRMKLRSDTCRSHISRDANTGSRKNSDDKNAGGSEVGTRSPIANLDEEHSRNTEEVLKNATRTACSTYGQEKGVIVTETRNRNSFNSINALIESFAKCSETTAPLAAGDDMGMNLLASVAAGEISKSESPTGSAGTSAPIDDLSTGNNEAKPRFSCDDDVVQGHSTSDEASDAYSEKVNGADPMTSKDEHRPEVTDISCSTKATILMQDTKLTGERIIDFPPVSSMNFQKITESFTKTEEKPENDRTNECSSPSKTLQVNDERVGDEISVLEDKQFAAAQVLEYSTDKKLEEINSSLDGSKSIECARGRIEVNACLSDTINKDPDVASCNNSEESPSASISKEVTVVSTSTEKLEPLLTEVTEKSDADAINSEEHGSQHHKYAEGTRGRNPKSLGEGHPEILNDEKHDVLTSFSLYEAVRPTVVSTSIPGAIDLKIKDSIESHVVGPSAEDNACHAKSTTSGLSEAAAEEQFAPSAKTPKMPATGEANIAAKLDFDLNEGITLDDGTQVEPAILVSTSCTSAGHLPDVSFMNPRPNGLPAPIAVASAKGPFLPPENLLNNRGEPGWKGSASTSAFRPAEPRKVLEIPLTPDIPSDSAGKQGRPPLDIDLNVADERAIDDVAARCSDQTGGSESRVVSPSRPAGGFDLDLNRVDDNPDNGQLGCTSHRLEVPLLPVKPASGGISNGEANVLRDFDLNNGPTIDDIPAEPVQRNQSSKSSSSVPFVPPVVGLRMNNADLGSVSSWFPLGSSYPAVALRSILPDRTEQQPYPLVPAPGAQRILGSVSGGGTFTNDIYRAPVLSSSPAMSFSPATAFPYAGFPFGSSFPFASTFSGGNTTYSDSASAGVSGFHSISSQVVVPAGAVPSHYQRPYVINIPEGGNTSVGSDNSRRWSRQYIDLNAGPGSATIESKDERLPVASRSLSVATSQVFMEEQSRTYRVPGGNLKRKEPEGGWDTDRSGYKQSSWH